MNRSTSMQPTAYPSARSIVGVGVVAAIALSLVFWSRGNTRAEKPIPEEATSLVRLLVDKPDTLELDSTDVLRELRIHTAEVHSAGSPAALRLPGTLIPDPDRMVRVNARFSGEAVRIGSFDGKEGGRQLQFGDRVKKGQLLAVIWSKDIGEKKSELVDAISKLETDRTLLQRRETLAQGVVSENKIFEARREVEADMISVAKLERTLRSWRLTEAEIDEVRQEAKKIKDRDASENHSADKSWAEAEVWAAIDGTILEKNFNVGDIVEHTDDLFKIADLSRLRVVAHIYEEDLWAVRALPPDQRKWSLDLKSAPGDPPLEGEFELIGSVIDTSARTGVLMGWVDNSDNKYSVGQFITASIQLPANPHEVAVPDTAVIEEGDRSMIFVQDAEHPLRFSRRRVAISRRAAGTVYLYADPKGKDTESVAVGERVIVSSALGLGGELEKLQSMSPAP